MATDCRLLGRPGRHRQTQPSEAVRTTVTTLLTVDCRLTLPKFRRNSITIPVVRDLVAAYDLLDRDDRVRVVVLTADHTAHAFCSGVSRTL